MDTSKVLRCDGCGQSASPEHIAKRLQRLEWTTRFRPVHVTALFLGAAAPAADSDFLYNPEGGFAGEGGRFLEAVGISPAGKTPEATLAAIQKAGFLLVYLLDCAVDPSANRAAVWVLLANRLPPTMARIRRSIKPKRVVPISIALSPLIADLAHGVACPLVLNGGDIFALDGDSHPQFPDLRVAVAAGTTDPKQ
jgi:hypothetical protein